MNDYPVLRLIVRYGTAGSVALAIVVCACVAYLGYATLGGLAVALGVLCGIVVFILGKSYAELVRIITEMLLPR